MSQFRVIDRGGALYRIAKPYVWTLPVVILSGIAASGLEGLGIGLVIPLLTMLQSSGNAATPAELPEPLGSLLSSYTPQATMTALCGVIFALILFKALVQMANLVFVAWIEGSVSAAIRKALAGRVLRMDYRVFLSEDTARLINIVASESWRTSDAVRHLADLLTSISAVLVFSVILFVINWHLFAFVVFGLVLLRGVQTLITRRVRALGSEITEANQDLAERMLLITDAIRPIRMFGRIDDEEARFAKSSERVRRAMIVVEKLTASIGPANEVFYGLLFIGVFLISGALGTSVPVLTAFLVLLYRMQPHVLTFSRAWLNLHAARSSMAEVEWLLNVPAEPAPKGLAGAPNLHTVQPLVFESVSFSYPGGDNDKRALHEVSFDTGSARVIALLGRSGSGKSTLVNLVCSLLRPDSGKILVNGADLTTIDPQDWRLKIGLAGQDVDLVDGSIADNIAYGAASVTMEQICAAAKQADADWFISELSNGYATEVGSRGTKLSGGQRQRIGLARALIRKPALLILDEATNAIDGLSETEIIKLLNDRDYFGTAIVISHRRKTLEACDFGVVMEDGRVVEQGPLGALDYYQRMEG
jgi:subfamily B ATP-binding cassette protein MsbA